MGTFHMALHKIHGTFEVTKSKDSTWKEWLSEEEYIYDDELEKIFLIKSGVDRVSGGSGVRWIGCQSLNCELVLGKLNG